MLKSKISRSLLHPLSFPKAWSSQSASGFVRFCLYGAFIRGTGRNAAGPRASSVSTPGGEGTRSTSLSARGHRKPLPTACIGPSTEELRQLATSRASGVRGDDLSSLVFRGTQKKLLSLGGREELRLGSQRFPTMQYDRVIEQALRDVQDTLSANRPRALECGSDTALNFVLRGVNHETTSPHSAMINRLRDLMDRPERNRGLPTTRA
jgi:hypothetical protein